MATNCLITKLKGTVDSSLLKVGEMLLSYEALSEITDGEKQQKLTLRGDNVVITPLDGAYMALSLAGLENDRITEPYTINSSVVNLYFPNINAKYVISNKYGLMIFRTQDAVNGFKINVNDLYGEGLNDVKLRGSKAYGDISFVANIKNTAAINFVNASGIYGDATSLGVLINSTSIMIVGTSISGSIEELVASFIANGRETETNGIASAGILTMLTFGDVLYGTAGTQYIFYSSVSKIIVANASSIASATKLWAKGATAEEISAWVQDGKTVVVVS